MKQLTLDEAHEAIGSLLELRAINVGILIKDMSGEAGTWEHYSLGTLHKIEQDLGTLGRICQELEHLQVHRETEDA